MSLETQSELVCLCLYVLPDSFFLLVHLSTFSLFSTTESYYYFVLIDLTRGIYGRVLYPFFPFLPFKGKQMGYFLSRGEN